jgi:putative DNA primase/helicase
MESCDSNLSKIEAQITHRIELIRKGPKPKTPVRVSCEECGDSREISIRSLNLSKAMLREFLKNHPDHRTYTLRSDDEQWNFSIENEQEVNFDKVEPTPTDTSNETQSISSPAPEPPVESSNSQPDSHQTIEKAIEETAEIPIPSNGSLLEYRLTDAGNAECFKQVFGDQSVFVPERKKWLCCDEFDQNKWTEDSQVLLKMIWTVRERGRQAWELQDSKRREEIIRWCLSSESKMKLNAALSIAESMLFRSINSFDADPWKLCCLNGVVDLKTGNLLKSKKEDWLYRSTNVVYDPTAKRERFLKFLEEIFNGDKELISFVQKAAGYSLTGITVEQVLFILYGTGANGKSKFLTVLESLLGDYGLTTPSSTFKDNPYYDGIPNDIARMAGARFVKSIEVKEKARLNEERIKALTGEDRSTARFLYKEWAEFTPMCKFWLAFNHKPIIRGTDEAIWRRIRLIPFEAYFPPEKRDRYLYEKLRSELSGILTWAVEGCLKWQREGLEPVRKIKEWTDNYRAESDLIVRFLEEKTIKTASGKTTAGDLYKAYESWCREQGEEYVITGTEFGKRMAEKGIPKKKMDYVYYLGIELVQDW